NEVFDWGWINARRDPSKSLADIQALAPAAWRRWQQLGEASITGIRRSVMRRFLVPAAHQQPEPGSELDKVLRAVRAHYPSGRESRFEAIAAWATEQSLAPHGSYLHFGVTRSSGDRGFDFLGRLDLSHWFGSVRLVVLGQAKCEKLNAATSGLDVARTVARL